MKKGISGEKDTGRSLSPENMNDYIRVIRPGVWVILTAVLVLLAAACVWGFFGFVESRVPVTAEAAGGTVVCRVEENQLTRVRVGQKVLIGEMTGEVHEIGTGTKDGYGYCMLRMDQAVDDGVYEGYIVTESIHPASFIFGRKTD